MRPPPGPVFRFTFYNATGGHLQLTASAAGRNASWNLSPGGRVDFDLPLRPLSVSYRAVAKFGEKLIWKAVRNVSGRTRDSIRLTLNRDYYVLTVHNRSRRRVRRMVTNKGLRGQASYTLRMRPGDRWNLGFHRAYTNSNVYLYGSGSWVWRFDPVSIGRRGANPYLSATVTIR